MDLRRDLGPVAATSVVVGSMIGSGIFFGPQIVAWQFTSNGIDPTAPLVLSVWAVAGFLSLLGALTFAELAVAMPESGGQYAYIREAFGAKLGFLQGWSSFFIGKAGSVAALAVAFGNLLSEVEGGQWVGTGLDVTFVAVGLITGLTLVNYVGVKFGGWVQSSTTVLKVLALVLLAGVAVFAEPSGDPIATAPIDGSGSLLAAFGLALVPALWAYDGWYNSTQVAEEIENPDRNLPLSLIGGTVLVIVVYAATNWAYLHVLGGQGLAGIQEALGDVGAAQAAQSPAGLTAQLLGGDGLSTFILAGVLISVFGTCNAVILTGPRIPFAMARDGVFFESLTGVHDDFATPHVALLVQGAWSLVLALTGTFEQLITLVVFSIWLWVGLGGLAVIVLRRKRPDMRRPYEVPLYPWIPLAFIALAGIFAANLILESPVESIVGTAIILAGLPMYFLARRPGAERDVELEEM
ncbi:amino acid permease [Thermoplasmatales archaeon SW_10_69_26]|nr:MAG: amino acid permease [Thermoplasmatales archaeon SW_10_69_26]